ncbi:hypothetical protein [Flagellimonas sp. 2504JD4-2]
MIKKALVIPMFFIFLSIEAQFPVFEGRIDPHMLPKTAVELIKKKYSGYKVKYYKIIEADSSIRFEAVLKKNKKSAYILFDVNGELTHTEKVVEFNTIPKEISILIEDDLDMRFKKYKISSCKTQIRKGRFNYKIELNTEHKKLILIYTSNGVFKSQKKLPEKPLGPIFH